MRSIQASEAKTHLPRLLNEVERGETLVITRHGRAIARIIPEAGQRQDEIAKAIAGIIALRGKAGRASTKAILKARDEGRKS
jgi:prevent-host-death family protein